MTIKQDALDIAAKLAAAEEAGSTPELAALHQSLRAGLYRNRKALNLSDDEVAEIDNYGPQARGGTPKGPSPEAE